jgi:hypothetical protein
MLATHSSWYGIGAGKGAGTTTDVGYEAGGAGAADEAEGEP